MTKKQRELLTIARAWRDLGVEDLAARYYAQAARLAGRNRKDRYSRVVSAHRVSEYLLVKAVDEGQDIDTVIIPRLLTNGTNFAKVMGL